MPSVTIQIKLGWMKTEIDILPSNNAIYKDLWYALKTFNSDKR